MTEGPSVPKFLASVHAQFHKITLDVQWRSKFCDLSPVCEASKSWWFLCDFIGQWVTDRQSEFIPNFKRKRDKNQEL